MDQGAKNDMDVPDGVSQRDDTVALEEDHAKLEISGVLKFFFNIIRLFLIRICAITLNIVSLPNKRRRLLEALIIQKHHSEGNEGKYHKLK